MIDPDRVVKLRGSADPADPPPVTVLFHAAVIVQGIPPELAVGSEIIRRHTRHVDRYILFIQQEVLGRRPDIRRIERDIKGHVAHDHYALFMRVLAEFCPLFKEKVLRKYEKPDILFQFRPDPVDGILPVHTQAFIFPFQPGLHLVGTLDSHKYSIVFQPEGICPAEFADLFRGAVPAALHGFL